MTSEPVPAAIDTRGLWGDSHARVLWTMLDAADRELVARIGLEILAEAPPVGARDRLIARIRALAAAALGGPALANDRLRERDRLERLGRLLSRRPDDADAALRALRRLRDRKRGEP